MLENKSVLQLLANTASENGLGTFVAVYNDIEKKWYYYIGNFKPSNPSNHIHHHSIEGKCINYILENAHSYFIGELAKNELILTKMEDLPKENKEFNFEYIWFK